jgi:NAD(P)-dependent dehydrogenase (short-subunit alcohol dehydrogenase family)
MSKPDLKGRRAIVTGAASGFGAGITKAVTALGATCVATDVDETRLAKVVNSCPEGSAVGVRLDVGDARAWAALIDEHGPFDLAVLNAGVATNHIRPEGALPLIGLDGERYRTVMAANVDGVVFGAQHVLPHMVETGFGDILVTASVAGLVPIAPDPIYGLTKHAVVGFVRSMAAALDGYGAGLDVHISAICPGFADTAILSEEAKANIQSLGLEILTVDRVVETMLRAMADRRNGAQWVVWPGRDDECYEWNPLVTLPIRPLAARPAGDD